MQVSPAALLRAVVALDGDTLMVGAPDADLDGGPVQAGRAHVTLRTGTESPVPTGKPRGRLETAAPITARAAPAVSG